jgi:predicted dehydrogenase
VGDSLRYGLIGGGFISGFQLRALRQVRGVEVHGLYAPRPPTQLAQWAREAGLGPARVFDSVRELAAHCDVLALFGPNHTRVDTLVEIAAAVRDSGARLRGLIAEKPLARNLGEARRVLELAREIGAPTAYFENQLHMRMVTAALAQLAPLSRARPLVLARAAEEHGGPHNAWFWDPTRQGGGVLCDMGCHSIALAWYALTPPGKPPRFLVPESVLAETSLLKWGQPAFRDELLARHGVDYARTPAEDFATGLIRFRNPETGQRVSGQFTVSWMYDKQGLRLLLDGIGPGYALEANSLRSPLEVFVSDAAAESVRDAELALEKAQATRGLLAVQPNEPDLYGYTDENVEAAAAFAAGRSALLDFAYGAEIVRLVMAAYLSAERGARVELEDPATQAELEGYVPLIQQGRGAQVLLR